MYKEMSRRIYLGNSMRGVFMPGDNMLLMVVPHAEILLGDVIVFHNVSQRDRRELVVHRVIAISDSGLITRGDNNLHSDGLPVLPEQIVGKVIAVQNGPHTKAVLGGFLGLCRANLFRFFLFFKLYFRYFFRRYYARIRDSRLVERLWMPEIQKIRFQTAAGILVKYLHRGRTVASWDAAAGKFICRKPFDLVIFPPGEYLNTE
jgi:hypothetical protein